MRFLLSRLWKERFLLIISILLIVGMVGFVFGLVTFKNPQKEKAVESPVQCMLLRVAVSIAVFDEGSSVGIGEAVLCGKELTISHIYGPTIEDVVGKLEMSPVPGNLPLDFRTFK